MKIIQKSKGTHPYLDIWYERARAKLYMTTGAWMYGTMYSCNENPRERERDLFNYLDAKLTHEENCLRMMSSLTLNFD
jgi:hypothetical protein